MVHLSVTYREAMAHVTFDLAGERVNTFSQSLLDELSEVITSIKNNPTVQWVVFDSAKPGIFIAGADIKELQAVQSEAEGRELINKGQQVFNEVAALNARTVALIDGVALGGGLEFSLACDFIVVTDSPTVRLGLPEVSLGIIPGWGGTQRLPKRVGLVSGVTSIVTGKPVTAKQALSMGLADAMVPHAFKHDALVTLIQSKRLKKRRRRYSFLEAFFLTRLVIKQKVKQSILKKTNGHYPAPLKACDVVFKTISSPIKKGLSVELSGVMDLLNTPIPKYLMGLFFSQEAVKKDDRLALATSRSIHQIGVVGAGLMGGGIGWWFINNGQSVRFKDVSWEMVRQGYQTIAGLIQKGVERRKIPASLAPLKMDDVSGTLSYSGFKAMDFIIEAVPEKMAVKTTVLKDIEANVPASAIIATNTSSLCVDEMASHLVHPERFLGVHFFSPVHRMPLVEIIPSKHTSDAVIADVYKMVLKNKKVPIVVKNCPGFLINRILLPYVNEAVHLLLQGYNMVDIDNVAVQFGMPIGPLRLADDVGLDIGRHVLSILQDGYGERMSVPETFKRMVDDTGLLGKKSGKGFYVYGGEDPLPNVAIYKDYSIVMKYRISDQDQTEISDRLMLVMLNEAVRCLDEGIIDSAERLDLAMIMGTGFPPFRGGLLRYADARGLGDIVHRLNQLAQTVDQRFKPCSLLLKMSQENRRFYR